MVQFYGMPSSQALTFVQKTMTLGLFSLTCAGAYTGTEMGTSLMNFYIFNVIHVLNRLKTFTHFIVGGAVYKILDKRILNPQNYSIEPGSGAGDGLPGPGPGSAVK